MGNETSEYIEGTDSTEHLDDDVHNDSNEKYCSAMQVLQKDCKDKKKESNQDIQPEDAFIEQLHHFQGKWLSHIRCRPLTVTNTLYAMNEAIKANKSKISVFNELICRYEDMNIHHSALEMTLNSADFNESESYLIFPDYLNIIKDSCIAGWYNKIDQIYWLFEPELNDNIDITEPRNVYDDHYGFIDNIVINKEKYRGINIQVSNEGVYDKYFIKNEQFLCECVLPLDILQVIFYDFVGDSHNDVDELDITKTSIVTNNETVHLYDWICHKLQKTNCDERIIYNTGLNLCGLYFNLETRIDVDCSVGYGRKTKIECIEYDGIKDKITGITSFKLSRQIS